MYVSSSASCSAGADQPVHNHKLSGKVELPGTGIEVASGCGAGGYAKADTYGFQSVTAPGGSNLPFLLLPMCSISGSRYTR